MTEIPYLDYPEIRIDEHESTEMPFRYVKDADQRPVMPEVSVSPRSKYFLLLLSPILSFKVLTAGKGMIDLIKKDSEKGFGELL